MAARAVLFYINPFNQGGIIHPEEVSAFLGHLDLPVDQGHCRPLVIPWM